MPDPQEQTTPPLAPPPATQPEQGALTRTFQREGGGFFKIDLEPYTFNPNELSLEEIHTDPSLSRHLISSPYIYTDALNGHLFTPELRRQIETLTDTGGKSLEAHYLANREQLRGTLIGSGEQFMNNLREAAPELHGLLERDISQRMDEMSVAGAGRSAQDLTTEEMLALERLSRANSFLNNYFVDTFYLREPPSQTAEANPLDGQAAGGPIISKTVIAFLPGANFSFAENTKRHPSLQQANTPPPGTNEQWAALVAAHETEHFIDASKDKDPKIMPPEVKAVMKTLDGQGSKMLAAMEPIMANLRETESDMSAMQALEGRIDPQIPAYWAALRIGDSMIEALPRLTTQKLNTTENNIFVSGGTLGSHDTGYFLSEYNETGAIPDYLTTAPTVMGFYEKTAEQYAERVKQAAGEAGIQGNRLTEIKPLTLSETVDLVQRTLAQDPPVYTPAEAQIAQTFVQSMTEQLGIERGNLDLAIRNNLQSLPLAPATTPPAPAPEVQRPAL
ncbi:MAG: hypothetical protein IPH06_05935 [Alphaproteobacteria bacterium]|nr:hypothetical protein [Alphaproteobacteria bacterium]QQS57559.1 MAG: hypothetical protein IPN28_01700 [Alphaproteobacteria bacterium]